ncbi:hypothetical protein [Pararobbsia alpina]|uniref:Uncharacterized protein n=1 Tax=Pararobbsia alpina TaxID=621374 RepID=A0A6S7AXE8_9BURK|nr:hypothetical protein [Pararobbsia alpina]CAB3780745.1 hypothetical protein LMG28138_01109 [Pararobbsia alpina]
MKVATTKPIIAGHWIGKTTAGIVCGFALALTSSGLLVRLTPGSGGDAAKAETAMLAVPLVWTAVFSAAYLFRTGPRAGLCLGAVSLLALALFEASK